MGLHDQGVHEAGLRTPGWRVCAGALLLTALCVLAHRALLGPDILGTLQGQRALSPLYASWSPGLRWQAGLFAVLAALCVWAAPRACATERTSAAKFRLGLALAAFALPLALFLVRQDLRDLGWPFIYYEHEEFWEDALSIASVPAFLRHYVELMPRLSLHGQHFPPGHALALHAVQQLGGGLVTAALAVLLALALGLQLAYFALRELLSERAARQAALLALAAPALLDFACTSMDAVFFLWAAAAWLAGLRALRPASTAGSAALAGLALGIATLSSFAALPVGLLVLLHALARVRARELSPTQALRQLAWIGAGCAAFFLLLWLLTGFSIVACFLQASAAGARLMEHNLGGAPHARWLEVSTGNLGAFLVGAGLTLVALTLSRRVTRATWAPAFLATLAVMVFGGLFHLEVERIWLFTLPWLAALGLAGGELSPRALRNLLTLSLVEALLMESLLFTLW